MKLLLIRHGLPEAVVRDDGGAADPPLSAVGQAQASKMAEWLAGEPIDRLYSSPMRRARETAEPLSALRGLTAEICDDVAEFDQHSSRYIPYEQLKARDRKTWERLNSGQPNEAFAPFAERVVAALEAIIAGNRGKTVAITCHGGIVNVWAARVMGFEPRMFFNPNYTSINRFAASSGGVHSVLALNEDVHTRGL
ncbi:MAG: histidine phosphatase family protein [Pseudomonadota bacterium]